MLLKDYLSVSLRQVTLLMSYIKAWRPGILVNEARSIREPLTQAGAEKDSKWLEPGFHASSIVALAFKPCMARSGVVLDPERGLPWWRDICDEPSRFSLRVGVYHCFW